MENELNEWSEPAISRGRLQGKVALITGGSSGIGLATAKRFVTEGAFVYITGRRQDELDKATALIGENITALQGDVSNLADFDRIYEAINLRHHRLDILFANAGSGTFEALGSITEAGFDQAFNINVRGTLFTVQKALPLLSSGASIILTGSSTGSRGATAFSVYSATKAAVRNFARSWALDLRGKEIRVNVLSPGATSTPGLLNLFDPSIQAQVMQSISDASPLGRVGDPEEIASVAVFLASDDSTFMTGSEVFADGGQEQV